MNTKATSLTYDSTGFFSKIVADYISNNEKLHPFYSHPVNLDGIKSAIQQRKQFVTDRALLINVLQQKYAGVVLTEKQQLHIQKLGDENTFTITTAHQPNIFTGHLYFIYKILHAIKLADELCEQIPTAHFVPVYYMGTEDADIDELGHIFVNGEKYEWQTSQTGAVGRMQVDKALVQMIDFFSGQLLIHPFGNEIISLIKDCYTLGITIELATFKFVNILFSEYGLLILQPDDASLKNSFAPIITKELTGQFSHLAVTETVNQFPPEYKVQAGGRALNLFYLQKDSRQRIEKVNGQFRIVDSGIIFSKEEILAELQQHPEKFSPNVILRPVFQEMILPNIAFIGGGGEIAYWLELKKVFEQVNVPYPMLVVRNSFLVVEQQQKAVIKKLGLSDSNIFKPSLDIVNDYVKKHSQLQVELAAEKQELCDLFKKIEAIAGKIEPTLANHSKALYLKSLQKVEALEKKLTKAERKKFEAVQRQVQKLKSQLFPHNNLQERVENFMPLYSKYGKDFFAVVYKHSLKLEQLFTIIEV
jgi:bacillithiol biosynthesis cysteine-adding enzyme BshC